MVAPALTATVPPSTSTVPPVAPGALPDASSCPLTLAVPSGPASSTMVPLSSCAVVAEIMPVVLTTLSRTSRAARAVSSTVPPAALMVPLLLTSADAGCPCLLVGVCVTGAVTAKLRSLSPWKSTVKALPPPSATVPSRASITPLFATRGPANTTSPPSAAVMAPALTIAALGLVEARPNV